MSRSFKTFTALLVLLMFFTQNTCVAGVDNIENQSVSTQIDVITQQNEQAQLRIQQLGVELVKLAAAKNATGAKQLGQAKLKLDLAKAELNRMRSALVDARQNLSSTEHEIHMYQERFQQLQVANLSRESQQDHLTRIQQHLEGLNQRMSLQQKLIQQIYQAKQLAHKRLNLYMHFEDELHKRQELQLHQSRIARMQTLTQQTLDQQQEWLAKIKKLTSDSIDKPSVSESVKRHAKLFYYQERINLSEVSLNFNQLQEKLTDLFAQNPSKTNLRILQAELPQVSDALADVHSLESKLAAKTTLVSSNRSIVKSAQSQEALNQVEANKLLTLFTTMDGVIAEQSQVVEKLKKRLSEYQSCLQKQLALAMAKRQGLPGLSWHAWLNLGTQFVSIPKATMKLLHSLQDSLARSLSAFTPSAWTFLLVCQAMTLLGMLLARVYLGRLVNVMSEKRSRITANALYIAAQLTRRNLIGLSIVLIAWQVMLAANIPFKFYATLVYITVVWFVFRGIIGLARLLLLERMNDADGHDVSLYHRLKLTFILGGIVTASTVLVHQLYLHYNITEMFNRMFMLFLLAVSLVLLRGRKLVPALIEPYLDSKRSYLQRAVRILSVLIPLSILSNALIGLIGYSKLAWMISYYQVVLVAVIAGYVIIRGLVVDILEILSEYSIRHLHNGWLWSEAILKPIDRILRMVVFIGMLAVVISLLDIMMHKEWLQKTIFILHYPLLQFSGGSINLLSSFEFFATGAFFIWAGRWAREFAYRWLFRDKHDMAARKSFSAFCQYAILTIGTIVSLRVLGIDLAGMAMILGGLAVGLGFGLRDVVNNVISGLMLLIERPVREGDLISIDNYEGEVTHIGIRAMRVRSWDHMEVTIPNAETFNKSFTNWTLQDSIVRTVVQIKVHRDDNIERVRDIIESVLSSLSEVLTDPEPQVLLREIGDVLIEFQVRYFINLQDHSRVVVRSQVLFAIHEALKKAGIRPPYPQQELHLLNQTVNPISSTQPEVSIAKVN